MFFTLHNFYILLSLYSLQLFMEFCQFVLALDLSFFFSLLLFFMEFCWFVAVGCFGFKFFCFCFCFFFLCRFPRFLLLPLLSKLWQRRITKFLLLDFLFPFFFVCNFYWIFGFLGFFYLVLILGLFQLIYSVFLIFILHWFGFSFSLFFLVMQFLLNFWFPRILLFDFNSGFVLV